jgi:error-prone DNA polymerase
MDAVEAVGLIKLDILAQGGLAVLRDTQATLNTQGRTLNLQALEVGACGDTEQPARAKPVEPWSDPGVWNMIATGNARGVHHIESPAMTSLACMADVRDIDRLVAIVSVIRPGAANGLKKAQFARRAQGLEPVCYTHESLAGVLRTTFGVVAYEEHILQICEAFGGLAPGRADVLRRALVKQDMKKVEEVHLEFLAAARARQHDETTIAKVWDLVAGFQGYAFCRAHSTAYAVEAYQGAYAKHYHPAEFMAGALSNGKGFYSALVYTLECRRLGIGFLSPCVNHPSDAFTIETSDAPAGTPTLPLGKAIRVPLRCIKDLSEATLCRWRSELARSPFSSVSDFCARVRPEGPEALNLIRAGAFDRLGGNRTEQFWRCLHASQDASAGAGWLFQGAGEADIRATFREEPSALQKLQDELELLSYTVTGHPLDLHPQIAWSTYCPIAELHRYHGQRVTVCGLIIVSRSHLQQNGQPMKFISICDYTGIVECEIFAAAYRLYGLNTVRYPVVQVTAEVKPFDNKAGYTLEVLRVEKVRSKAAPAFHS